MNRYIYIATIILLGILLCILLVVTIDEYIIINNSKTVILNMGVPPPGALNSGMDKITTSINIQLGLVIAICILLIAYAIYYFFIYDPIPKGESKPLTCSSTSLKDSTIFIQSNDDSIYDPTANPPTLRESYILNYKAGNFLNMAIPGGTPCITQPTTENLLPVIYPNCQESIVAVDKDHNKIYCLITHDYTSSSPLPCVFTNDVIDNNPPNSETSCNFVKYTKGEVWYIDSKSSNSNNIWRKTPITSTVIPGIDRLDQTIVYHNGYIYKIDFPTTTVAPADNSTLNTVKIRIMKSTNSDPSLVLNNGTDVWSSGKFEFISQDTTNYGMSEPLSYSVSANTIGDNINGNVLVFTIWPTTPDTTSASSYTNGDTKILRTRSWIVSFNMNGANSTFNDIIPCTDGVYTASAPVVMDGNSVFNKNTNFYVLRADMLCNTTTTNKCGLSNFATPCYGLRMIDTKNNTFIDSEEYQKRIILYGGVSLPLVDKDKPKHPIYQMYSNKNTLFLPYSPALYEIRNLNNSSDELSAKNILPITYSDSNFTMASNFTGTLDPGPSPFNECGSIAMFYSKSGSSNNSYILMINPRNRRMIQRYNIIEKNVDGEKIKDSEVGVWIDEKPYIYSGKPTLNVMSCNLEHSIIIIPPPLPVKGTVNDNQFWRCKPIESTSSP